jgi:dTDP-4-amino-4,6-dideoxygalactose transaminase
MNVPLVDLKAQYRSIKPEVDVAIQRVLDHTGFILGEEVKTFEAAFADYLGASGTVGVASGTAALQLALQACGVGRGDEVITTAHTFIATAEPIVNLGALPIFVDIDPATFNMDPDCVESAITSRTKAIVPVHLYGRPAPMDELMQIADRHGLTVIEDAAQAHGARYRGRSCGTIGSMGCFSFYPGKNLGAYGDGGAVTSNDAALLARVRKLRDHGRTTKYEHDEIGYGERLDALQAAVLGTKLRHLADWTAARRSHAHRYSGLLAGAGVTTPTEDPQDEHVFHLYVVRARRRDALLEHLVKAGIGAGIHYPIPLHRQAAFRDLPPVSLPHTELAASEILSLPLFPELRDDQIELVADQVREFGR